MLLKKDRINIKLLFAILVVLCVFVVYFITLAPTVLWGDPSKLYVFAHNLVFGLHAAVHPLHNVVGWLWGQLPFSDYAYGQNLLSAIFASAAIGIIFLIVMEVTGSIFSSFLASMALALSHTFWWLAVINESYSLLFVLFSLAVFMIIKWTVTGNKYYLYGAFMFLGLSLSNHYLTYIFIPVFVVYSVIKDKKIISRPLMMLCIISVFAVGAGLLIYIFIRESVDHGVVYSFNMIFSSSIRPFWRNSKIIKELMKYPAYLFFQFPLIGFIVGFVGIKRYYKENLSICIFLLSLLVIDVLFSAGYMWERQPEIMVPGYVIYTIFVGIGLSYIKTKLRRKYLVYLLAGSIVLFPVVLYSYLPWCLNLTGIRLLNPRTLPYRDNNKYFIIPSKKGYDGARKYGEEIMDKALPNAMIFGDFTPMTVLKYMQTIENKRSDISLVWVDDVSGSPMSLELVKREINSRPLYILDEVSYQNMYKINELKETYKLVKYGNLIRILIKDKE